jgi:hypothetical protein
MTLTITRLEVVAVWWRHELQSQRTPARAREPR